MTKHRTSFIVTQRNIRNNVTNENIWRCAKCGIRLDPGVHKIDKGLCNKCILIDEAKKTICCKCKKILDPAIFLDDTYPDYMELIYICDNCGTFWNKEEVVYT